MLNKMYLSYNTYNTLCDIMMTAVSAVKLYWGLPYNCLTACVVVALMVAVESPFLEQHMLFVVAAAATSEVAVVAE
jgi:hypothetical protein